MSKIQNIVLMMIISTFVACSGDRGSKGDAGPAGTPGANPVVSAVDWSALCPAGQALTDITGCLPNCNSGDASETCDQIFDTARITQMTSIASPYLDNGIVFFELTQVDTTLAYLQVKMASTPAGFGYQCEFLNSDATPATLWDVSSTPIPNTTVTLDSTVNPNTLVTSDVFVNAISQPVGSGSFWFNNPNNTLYMMCVGYAIDGINDLISSPACGGTGNTCVTMNFIS